MCPYFDDLYYYADRSDGEGIYYSFNSANTTVTYEFVLSRGGTNELYQFTVFYDSAVPGVFTFIYYQTGQGNDGETASVGTQGLSQTGAQVAAQYEFEDQGSIYPGLQVVCNTNNGNGVCNAT